MRWVLPSKHLSIQKQQKYQKKVSNLFKGNNKDTTTPLALFWCLYCIVEFEQILHLFVVFRLLFLRCMFYWVPFKIDEDTRTCTVHCFSVFIIVYFSYWVRFLSDSAFQKCFKKQHCKPFLWIFQNTFVAFLLYVIVLSRNPSRKIFWRPSIKFKRFQKLFCNFIMSLLRNF